ncbi:hypothetical protein [Geofilum rhodophaeum]|nr:hypothetical protein [Geofilum rhodophaeum]
MKIVILPLFVVAVEKVVIGSRLCRFFNQQIGQTDEIVLIIEVVDGGQE